MSILEWVLLCIGALFIALWVVEVVKCIRSDYTRKTNKLFIYACISMVITMGLNLIGWLT